MSAPFHYGKDYFRYRKRAILFGIPAIIIALILIGVGGIIAFYNVHCAGPSCDGGYCQDCSPVTAPGLFSVLILMLIGTIILAIMSILNIDLAKRNKIPIYYTAQELEQKVFFHQEYYKYRNAQIAFTVLAGFFGNVLFNYVATVLYIVIPGFEDGAYEMTEFPIEAIIVLSAVGLILGAITVVFIVLACVNMKRKKTHAVRYMAPAFTGNPYGGNYY